MDGHPHVFNTTTATMTDEEYLSSYYAKLAGMDTIDKYPIFVSK
jgi:hypothetical protein